MSAATIDKTLDQTSVNHHDVGQVDVAAWINHTANLRRAFTGVYVPRHRADGPAR